MNRGGDRTGGLVWREALRFGILPAIAAAAFAWFGRPVAAGIAVAAAVGVALFFRDPRRSAAAPREAILAPADGRVVEVRDPGPDGPALSIFLSLFDVHVNRAPAAGRILTVHHRRGRYLPAFSPRAHTHNQSTEMLLETDGGPVRMRQIAGLIARRIVCWKRPGDRVERGERVGLIRFGSRVELVLPDTARLSVRRGDRVRAGVTEVGRFPAPAGAERADG